MQDYKDFFRVPRNTTINIKFWFVLVHIIMILHQFFRNHSQSMVYQEANWVLLLMTETYSSSQGVVETLCTDFCCKISEDRKYKKILINCNIGRYFIFFEICVLSVSFFTSKNKWLKNIQTCPTSIEMKPNKLFFFTRVSMLYFIYKGKKICILSSVAIYGKIGFFSQNIPKKILDSKNVELKIWKW